MPRHPVEQNAEAVLVAVIDEVAEIFRASEARGRGKKSGALVAPGIVQRMLGHRQQLDVGEAQRLQVVHQLMRQLAVVEKAPVVRSAPGAEMDFIRRHRPDQPVAAAALLDPGRILPDMLVGLDYAGSGAWPQFEFLGIGIGLDVDVTGVALANFVLVQIARLQTGNEQLPHPGRAARTHGMAAPVPRIEIAHHADALGVGRPHGKAHSLDLVDRGGDSAQHAPGLIEFALGEQVKVMVGELRRETVGIPLHIAVARDGMDAQLVGP